MDKNKSIFGKIIRDIKGAIKDTLKEIENNRELKEYKTKRKEIEEIQKENSIEKKDTVANYFFSHKEMGKIYRSVGYIGTISLFGINLAILLNLLRGYYVFGNLIYANLSPMLLTIPLNYIFYKVLKKGKNYKKAIENYSKYWEALKQKGFARLEEMAYFASLPVSTVKKDIEFMLKEKFFEKAILDREENVLILNQANYLAHKDLKLKKGEIKDPLVNSEERLEESKSIKKALEQVKNLKIKQKELKNEDMKEELANLIDLSEKIINTVEKKPENQSKIRKFLNYYLPTTESLLNSYIELELQGIKGENVEGSMIKIEESMTSLSKGFEELLDQLFQKDAWAIHGDLAALEAIMASDGLIGEDFIKEEENNG